MNTVQDVYIANVVAEGLSFPEINLDISTDEIRIHNLFPVPDINQPTGPAHVWLPDGHYRGQKITIENYGTLDEDFRLHAIVLGTINPDTLIDGFEPLQLNNSMERKGLWMSHKGVVTLEWTGYSWFITAVVTKTKQYQDPLVFNNFWMVPNPIPLD